MSNARFYPNDIQPDWWADLPGYNGTVQVSRIGEVRRVWPDGTVSMYVAYMKHGETSERIHRRRRFVKLRTPGGKVKEIGVHKAVWLAFNGHPPKGLCVYHLNGDVADNRLDNLGLIDRKKLGHMTGGTTNRWPRILKIDRDGEIVQIFQSAREAAAHEFMSSQAILDRCHGRVKNPYALNGYTYQFDT